MRANAGHTRILSSEESVVRLTPTTFQTCVFRSGQESLNASEQPLADGSINHRNAQRPTAFGDQHLTRSPRVERAEQNIDSKRTQRHIFQVREEGFDLHLRELLSQAFRQCLGLAAPDVTRLVVLLCQGFFLLDNIAVNDAELPISGSCWQ